MTHEIPYDVLCQQLTYIITLLNLDLSLFPPLCLPPPVYLQISFGIAVFLRTIKSCTMEIWKRAPRVRCPTTLCRTNVSETCSNKYSLRVISLYLHWRLIRCVWTVSSSCHSIVCWLWESVLTPVLPAVHAHWWIRREFQLLIVWIKQPPIWDVDDVVFVVVDVVHSFLSSLQCLWLISKLLSPAKTVLTWRRREPWSKTRCVCASLCAHVCVHVHACGLLGV